MAKKNTPVQEVAAAATEDTAVAPGETVTQGPAKSTEDATFDMMLGTLIRGAKRLTDSGMGSHAAHEMSYKLMLAAYGASGILD